MGDAISKFSDISQTGWFAAVLAYHLVVGYWGLRFLREEREAHRKEMKEASEMFVSYMEKRNSAMEKELQKITATQATVAERLTEHAKLLDRMDQRSKIRGEMNVYPR